MFGDSITSPLIQWYGPTAAAVNARLSSPATFINKGVPGDTVAALLSRVNADVIANSPNFVVIEVGINDLSTSLPSFGSTYETLLATIKADLPSCRFALVSCFCRGEQYPDPTYTQAIADRNAIISNLADAYHAAYIDVRTPQQAWEQANNTPSPGVVSGLLTIETPPTLGIHPNNSLGIPIYTTAALARIVTH